MSMTENTIDPQNPPFENFIILSITNGRLLATLVSVMRQMGWKLHGSLQLCPVADLTSPTMVGMLYSQAMYRDLKPEEYIGDAKRDPMAKTPDD